MRALGRRFFDRVREATGAGGDPSRFAASWAVGIGLGLSPFLGAQTLLAVAAALLFRLNKVDVLLGTLISNPWTLTVYFPAAVVLGSIFTGGRLAAPSIPEASQLMDFSAWRQQSEWLRPVLESWLVGAAVIAILASAVTFFVVRRAARRLALTSSPSAPDSTPANRP